MRIASQAGLVILALAIAWGVGAAAAEPARELGEREKSFVDQMAAKDLAEIELSKLIKTKTASPAVRRLARTILAEDTANYAQVFKLCLRRQYAIAPQLDERHSQLLRELHAARSSRALGRKYIDTLLVDESHMHGLLLALAENKPLPDDQLPDDMKRFAADSAQMIARHERMARELASK